jgi:hypothetical protein
MYFLYDYVEYFATKMKRVTELASQVALPN